MERGLERRHESKPRVRVRTGASHAEPNREGKAGASAARARGRPQRRRRPRDSRMPQRKRNSFSPATLRASLLCRTNKQPRMHTASPQTITQSEPACDCINCCLARRVSSVVLCVAAICTFLPRLFPTKSRSEKKQRGHSCAAGPPASGSSASHCTCGHSLVPPLFLAPSSAVAAFGLPLRRGFRAVCCRAEERSDAG